MRAANVSSAISGSPADRSSSTPGASYPSASPAAYIPHAPHVLALLLDEADQVLELRPNRRVGVRGRRRVAVEERLLARGETRAAAQLRDRALDVAEQVPQGLAPLAARPARTGEEAALE